MPKIYARATLAQSTSGNMELKRMHGELVTAMATEKQQGTQQNRDTDTSASEIDSAPLFLPPCLLPTIREPLTRSSISLPSIDVHDGGAASPCPSARWAASQLG